MSDKDILDRILAKGAKKAVKLNTYKQVEKQPAKNKPVDIRPANDRLENINYNGWMGINCSFFESTNYHLLKPSELKLFLYFNFLRFRYSDKKNRVRASIEYLENGTGLTKSTVKSSMKSLKEKGYLKLVETNFKLGNLYEIKDEYLNENKQGKNKLGENKPGEKRLEESLKETGSEVKRDQQQVEIKPENNTLKQIKNLLPQKGAEKLKEHFKEMPEEMARKELVSLEKLLGQYDVPLIEEVLRELLLHGVDSKTEAYFPLTYISKAGKKKIIAAKQRIKNKKENELAKKQQGEIKPAKEKQIDEEKYNEWIFSMSEEDIKKIVPESRLMKFNSAPYEAAVRNHFKEKIQE